VLNNPIIFFVCYISQIDVKRLSRVDLSKLKKVKNVKTFFIVLRMFFVYAFSCEKGERKNVTIHQLHKVSSQIRILRTKITIPQLKSNFVKKFNNKNRTAK